MISELEVNKTDVNYNNLENLIKLNQNIINDETKYIKGGSKKYINNKYKLISINNILYISYNNKIVKKLYI